MKFGEWTPDRDVFENQGLVTCLNVTPDTYYRPFRDLVGQGTAMSGACIGAVSFKDDANNAYNFAGVTDKLYRLDSNSWVSINTGYTTSGNQRWRFARFGDLVLATNRADVVQKYDITSDSAFSALGGTPPKARHIAVVRDFVVLGNLSTDENTVIWSGINDAEQWTAGTGESDSQILPEGGAITGVVGGEFGLVFQENSITRMEYQGPPLGFAFDVIEQGHGCIASGSLVRQGIFTYYLSRNGFHVTDGSQSQDIGTTKIEKYFFAKADETLFYKMSAVSDPLNNLIIWSYVGQDSSDGNPNWLLLYNYELKRWSEVNVSHEQIFNSLSAGYTLEGLDALYPDLDAMPISLDSRSLQGGTTLLSGITTLHEFGTFTGDVLPACIATGEFELNKFQRTFLKEVWPVGDGTITVKVGYKDTHQTSTSYTAAYAINSSGYANFLANNRLHSFQFDFTDFTRASGFEVKAEVTSEY